MIVTAGDKLRVLVRSLIAAVKMPGRFKLMFLLQPVDATRYLEFGYLLKYLEKHKIRPKDMLDVSSPVMVSYLLSKTGRVCKTDIDKGQQKFVKPSDRLFFRCEDATGLSFSDNQFDLVYSISVIEHIYDGYMKALEELIRVTRNGGLIYVTFPVSKEFTEEWVDFPIYSDQAVNGERTFFQYRFGPEEYENMTSSLSKRAEIMSQNVFWERRSGLYDELTERLRKDVGNVPYRMVRAGLLNLLYGPTFFEREPGSFDGSKPFGNAQLILRKRYPDEAG